MSNGYSNVLYGCREPNNRSWQAASTFELAPENEYRNVDFAQRLHYYDEDGILPTPISYPKVSIPQETLESSEGMFKFLPPNSVIWQQSLLQNPLHSGWLHGQEAIFNHQELSGQSSNLDPSHQLKEKRKNIQVMQAEHGDSEAKVNHLQPSKIKYSCEWQGCTYSGQFRNEATLMRHISSIHVSPNKFQCTQCAKVFNRKDRYRTHVHMVHSAKE